MVEKLLDKATDYSKCVFSKEIIRDFAQEFLPRDKYLELKLQKYAQNVLGILFL